jgi:thiosulfate dehydrogenase
VGGWKRMGRVLFGIILGIVLVPVSIALWFHFGKPPVAVADTPFWHERQITRAVLNARIDSEEIKTPPIPADETAFMAGAQIYRDECASCHGFHGRPSPFAAHMYPKAPQLWEKHHTGSTVGVSDDPPGETYWRVSNGIRLTGMPSYKDTLSDTQMWQVTLLLANADKPLPPAALDLLRPAAEAAASVAKAK